MNNVANAIQVYDGDGVKFTPPRHVVERMLKGEGKIYVEVDGFRIGITYAVKEIFYKKTGTSLSHNISVNGPGFGGVFGSHNHHQWCREEGFTEGLPLINYIKIGKKRVRLVKWKLTENLLIMLVMQRFGAVLSAQVERAKRYGKSRIR